MARLRAASNRPCASSRAFRRRNCSYSAPAPRRCIASTTSCSSPRGSYTARRPRSSTCWPSCGVEVEQRGRAAEHRAAQQRAGAVGVLQREVAVPAGGPREARQLAAHRDRAEARRQRVAGGQQQRADAPGRRAAAALASAQPSAKPSVHAAADTPQPRQPLAETRRHARHRTVTFVQVLDLQRNSAAENLGNEAGASNCAALRPAHAGLPTKLSTVAVDYRPRCRAGSAGRCGARRAAGQAAIIAPRRAIARPMNPLPRTPCFRSYKPPAGRSGP